MIIEKIKKEVEQKLVEKKSRKKRLKNLVERSRIKILYRIFGDSKIQVKRYQQSSRFGCDEFGRDVEDGLYKYINILKNRGLEVHTVILLGSRAKGTWTPKSDVDVTIVASNLPKERKNFALKRLLGLKRQIVLSDRPLYLGIEPSGCCSKEEFVKKLRSFDTQALDAIFYGQIIYDDGFWKIVKTEYSEMEKKYGLKDLPLKELLFPL